MSCDSKEKFNTGWEQIESKIPQFDNPMILIPSAANLFGSDHSIRGFWDRFICQ
jgi:hypothetical protein